MPIRQRLRRALTRSNLRSDASSSSDTSSKYEPPMPPLKYRRPVDPAHRERLIAFSFETAWRRPSAVSHRTIDCSPGNSRLPSRRNSSVPQRKSMQVKREDSAVEKMSESSSSGEFDLSSIGVALTSPFEVRRHPGYELERPKTAPSHRFVGVEPPPFSPPLFSQAELNRAFAQ